MGNVPDMDDMAFWPARRLASAVRRRKVGCVELLELYLRRCERYNPALNAVITTDLEAARRRAREADAALARGEVWGPLHGLPMTIKESYDVAGMPTTWGVPELRDNIAATNALAVERLLGAGAVIYGKTNVPFLLADWQSFNAIYGTTNNPWDLARSPGGSSGGSAAALAAGLTALEAGSDIGASIRNPAHYCGVFGHKTTYGIASPRGQALPGRVSPTDISVIGPMARGAADLDLILRVMAGPDQIDAKGWRLALPAPKKKTLADYKVALMLDEPTAEVDRSVQDRLQALADFLARQGAVVDDRARPDIDTGGEGPRALHQAAARRHLGAAERCRARPQPPDRPGPPARRRELFRPHDPGLRAAASGLAGGQRGAPPDAVEVGRLLRGP